METASPAVHTLPAARLALAAPPGPALGPTGEGPRELLSLIHPRDSACSLLGTAQGTSGTSLRDSTAQPQHPQPHQTGGKIPAGSAAKGGSSRPTRGGSF